MLSAGAPYRDGQVAAVGSNHLGNPVLEKIRDVFLEPLDGCMALEKFHYPGVATRERREPRLPKGVRQAACVEDEVGVARDTLAISERLEQDRHAAFGARTDALTNQFAQLMDARASGIDDQVGSAGDRLQQLSFLRDGFREP